MSMERITLLEQRLSVLSTDLTTTRGELNTTQREISEVLGEIQKTMAGLARATSIALAALEDRIISLEPERMMDADIPSPENKGVEL